MRVIIINDHSYINGGAAKVAVSMAKSLAERGVDTCLFSGVLPVEEGIVNKRNLRIICLNQYDILNDPHRLRAVGNGIWNKAARREFLKLLNEYNPNDTIIHVHDFLRCLSVSVFYAAQEKGFKVVCHLHTYGLVCPNLAFYHFGKRTVCHCQPLSIDCVLTNCDARCYAHKLWRCARHFIQTKFIGFPEKLNAVIYISKFSYRVMEPFLASQTKRFFLPNYVEKIGLERVGAENNDRFVFVGRLEPEKAPITLAKAAKALSVPVTFVGAGSLEDDIRSVNPNVEITGWVDSSEVSDYLKKARCLVFPSVWYECHPLVVIEALQMGIPVITSNGCAAIDMVVDGENGCLFKSGNEYSLANAMAKLLDDERTRRLSEGAWRSAADNDDAETYIDKLLAIYESVLDG